MFTTLSISPHGKLLVDESPDESSLERDTPASKRIMQGFTKSSSHGLLHLATVELQTHLPPAFGFARDFAGEYLTRLSRLPSEEGSAGIPPLPPPASDELGMRVLQAPLMKGLEYLNAEAMAGWWMELDTLVRAEAQAFPGGLQAYLREKNPLWRLVGRVTFHLAENKRNPDFPFAFLATYASRLSSQARVQHLPLGRALKEYGGSNDRGKLLSLLLPIDNAAKGSDLVKELFESGDIYNAVSWNPKQAYRFLRDVPVFEASGLIVRVPDWWKATRPPRPIVSVKVGEAAKSKLGADAILDFSVGLSLEGEPLTEQEIQDAMNGSSGLVKLKGKWVEIDREKLDEALTHWKDVAREAKGGGLSFFEGMRLLSGAPLAADAAAKVPEAARQWSGIQASDSLEKMLSELRDPGTLANVSPVGLKAELRPYQQVGVNWLRFVTRLGLGACLADDMGLGKTIQVITLLLHLHPDAKEKGPSLLVVPASLIANWKSELSRFAPSLSSFVAHPSEMSEDEVKNGEKSVENRDLVITTYGMLARINWLREKHWRLIILDEAQAIKNSGSRQTRVVKELKGTGRIALTGTPIENRLSDLWSLFDFLNPGLLGSAKAFSTFAKGMEAREHNPYGPLRTLVKPYILRRLKTDKRIIADLPDKTEVNAFCSLSKRQALLYEQAVRELAEELKRTDGIQRRGIVLAYLMRLKQICNHPAQLTGDGDYNPEQSGKFQRITELCGELAERQEKALVFTQFREITSALSDHLQTVFGKPGLVLTGQTAVPKRRELVEAFQREDGPPFFVLSLKAGGTGLNLTAASHVIHFDRWWNPAVENQATDRAFRIGQKRNVFVHKFVCRGTVEDKIDELIMQKSGMAKDLLDSSGTEVMLTEMSTDQLLNFVALNLNTALDK